MQGLVASGSDLNRVRQTRLLTSAILVLGLLLSPVHQAMACAMEAPGSGGGDAVHSVDPPAGNESAGVDGDASPDGHDSCACACSPALAFDRPIHHPAGIRSAGETDHRLLQAPPFRQLRPPRPASV